MVIPTCFTLHSPVYMADSSSYDVIIYYVYYDNEIVERQLESMLLIQPWRGLTKRYPKFPDKLKKALTASVMSRENPPINIYLGPPKVKCRLLIPSIFDAMNFKCFS